MVGDTELEPVSNGSIVDRNGLPPHIPPHISDSIRQLLTVIGSWDALSDPLREAVLAIVRTAPGKEVQE
jgi:hypothetical protein